MSSGAIVLLVVAAFVLSIALAADVMRRRALWSLRADDGERAVWLQRNRSL